MVGPVKGPRLDVGMLRESRVYQHEKSKINAKDYSVYGALSLYVIHPFEALYYWHIRCVLMNQMSALRACVEGKFSKILTWFLDNKKN